MKFANFILCLEYWEDCCRQGAPDGSYEGTVKWEKTFERKYSTPKQRRKVLLKKGCSDLASKISYKNTEVWLADIGRMKDACYPAKRYTKAKIKHLV